MLQLSVNLLTQRTAITGFHMQKKKHKKRKNIRQEQILNNQQSSIHIKNQAHQKRENKKIGERKRDELELYAII